jgi:hypothetical protein
MAYIFNIEKSIMEYARGFDQFELYASGGGGGFDFIKRQISADKICALVGGIPDADFSPDDLNDSACVSAYSFSACENYGDYSETLYKGTARACIDFMAALPRVNKADFIEQCAREIAADNVAQYNKTGLEKDYGFSMLCEKSGIEINNIFTSSCARFDLNIEQARAEYGAEFVSAWIKGAIDYHGVECLFID